MLEFTDEQRVSFCEYTEVDHRLHNPITAFPLWSYNVITSDYISVPKSNAASVHVVKRCGMYFLQKQQ